MRAIAVLVFLLFASQSNAEQVSVCNGRTYKTSGFSVPCSHTWALHATCTSNDLVHEWRVDGNTEGDSYLRPFADMPIIVIGYEMVKLGGTTIWFMIGSGHQPDGFLWMGPGESHARRDFHPGLGHPWPSKQSAAEKLAAAPGHNEMINVHGACSDGPVTILVTVYYVSSNAM